MTYSIACVGEAMIELAPLGSDTARVGVAGDAFNTAVYLRRVLDPARFTVSFVTALGDDPASGRIDAALQAENIDTALVERRPGSAPGLYMIHVDAAGERSFSYWRSASAARSLFSPPGTVGLDQLNGFDVVYLSGISLAILPQAVRAAICNWADEYRAAGGRIAFDSNYRPRLWEDVRTARQATMEMWWRCDVALPSLDDEMALFDEDEPQVLRRLRDAGVRYGALKRGDRGPCALGPEQTALDVEPVRDVVDTTAAGDSFNAAFLAGHICGEPVETCLRRGHDLASIVIRHKGAVIAPEYTQPLAQT